ncbi:hypothetical protein B0I37DRAFT_404770 [Chaetomium sp. MPI-CAGE-AT-0009]|nr:hypothetical protein B0I37DRAFT_404770 [Chaetomium sp. MPI-CAGE-AT-0009]
MSENPFGPVGAEDVVGVPELGAMILGFLEDFDDLRCAALVSKRFNRAAQFHLWAAIKLPYHHADPSWIGQRPFWDKFASYLERNTFSLRVDFPAVVPTLAEIISWRPWEARVRSDEPEWLVTKDGVDDFFAGLKETLTRAPRLRSFTARDVPRILDLAVLLQHHRPELVSLDITASKRDTLGLLYVPDYCIDRWAWEVERNPSPTVSLGNSINFSLDMYRPKVRPVFNFPNLRVLALNNIQYDGRRPSPFLTNLVRILKGSPSLSHLELSLRHEIGGMSPHGDFVRRLYAPPDNPDGPHNAMEVLCDRYHLAGGKPLNLKTLTLGYGFEIRDEHPAPNFNGPPARPHRLAQLTDLATLGGLHLQGIHYKDGLYIRELGWQHGFSLLTNHLPWNPICSLPRLRKITWPWEQGRLLRLLWLLHRDLLRKLVVRIDVPSSAEWITREGDTYPSWFGAKPRHHTHSQGIQIKGLVLPTDSMCPQQADIFLSWVPWIDGLQALKIRMPLLTANNKGRTYMKTFWRRIERMKDLRELWLADGLGSWQQPEGEGGRHVPERYPTEVEFRRFSAGIALRCPKLVYLRMLDRAWHITRTGEGDQEQAHLYGVTKGRLEKDIPDSFDFSTPKYI